MKPSVNNESSKYKRGQRIYELMERFMKVPTHTHTPMECAASEFYEAWFSELKQKAHSCLHVGHYDVEGDALNRKIGWALVKGDGNRTVVLMHHSDTADILDFGAFEAWAYEPEKLSEALKNALHGGTLNLSQQAIQDLTSGQWTFGRGGCDMKAGGAIEMAMIEHYLELAELGQLKGNVLMLGLPDEENLSAGMRAAPLLLEVLKEQHGLEYALMINTEPHERESETVGILYAGSVGKIMPVCYVKGVAAHVGQVYQGLNPILLLSEIIGRTEMRPEFVEAGNGEAVTPPLWLYCKDRKQNYDVSLPLGAAGYMSVLSLGRTPEAWLKDLAKESQKAFQVVLDKVKTSCDDYENKTGTQVGRPHWKPQVRLFSELIESAAAVEGAEFKVWLSQQKAALGEKLSAGLIDMPEATCQLIEAVLVRSGETEPVVIWGLSPPYYPCVSSKVGEAAAVSSYEAMVDMLKHEARETYGQKYEVKEHFFGICDLSYAECHLQDCEIQSIQENMPLWGQNYDIPFENIKNVSMPVINIGPWGKDFHKLTERVLTEDVCERTPHLVMKAVDWTLKGYLK